MTILKHVLISTVYVLLALTMALLLPDMVPSVSAAMAWIVAALILVAGLFLHETFTRNARERAIMERLYLYAEAYERLQSDVIHVQKEIKVCRAAIEEVKTEPETTGAMETMMSEVRILQSLVEKLSGRAPAMAGADVQVLSARLSSVSQLPPSVPPPPVADLGETEILDAVREALRHDQVDLYLQPIVSLPQRKVRYYECFSRIRAGGDSVILPEQFIGLSKREGLLGAIDNILLFRCVQLVRRAQKRRHNVGFFCNISAHTLGDRAFFADFSEFIAANAELASQLVFELNQDDVANRWDEVAPFLMRLARLGFTFSLDRVTNLDLDVPELTRRHFRFVKIDVAGLLARARQDAQSIASLKRSLDRAGIDLIVEKIEDEADLIEALDFQIDFGQGYLFGGPQKSREV
jgi:cyclic-di-GMP phosphodiesterase TipF (flagellum assembly factor)